MTDLFNIYDVHLNADTQNFDGLEWVIDGELGRKTYPGSWAECTARSCYERGVDYPSLMGMTFRGKEEMVFDWEKAANMILKYKPKVAMAGLRDDWNSTGGVIYAKEKPLSSTYTYLASTWAVPEIDIDGVRYECYKMEHEVPRWNAKTKWPAVALKILGKVEK